MKKIMFIVLIIAFFIANPFSGAANPTMSFATVDFAPYSFQNQNNEIKGIEVDIIKRMCEIAGISYTIVFYPFPRALASVQNSEIDALFNFYKNDERLKIFTYSDPILENPLVLFVKKGSSVKFTGKMDDLKGLLVGVMRGYTYSKEFDDAKASNVFRVEEADTHEQNFKKLVTGKIDVYPVEKNVGLWTAKGLGLTNEFTILEIPLKIQQGFFGMAKNNPKTNLITLLNGALAKIRSNGEYQQIFDNYLKK